MNTLDMDLERAKTITTGLYLTLSALALGDDPEYWLRSTNEWLDTVKEFIDDMTAEN